MTNSFVFIARLRVKNKKPLVDKIIRQNLILLSNQVIDFIIGYELFIIFSLFYSINDYFQLKLLFVALFQLKSLFVALA